MKYITFACGFILCVTSCTKNIPNEYIIPPETITKVNQVRTLGTPTVNMYGFLSFATIDEYTVFLKRFGSITAGDLLAYYRQIGFTCFAKTQGLVGDVNDLIPEGNQYLFLLSTDRMIEVNGFLLKLSANEDYLYTMSSYRLYDYTYEELNNEQLNLNRMNRFAAMGALAQADGNLLSFIAVTPSGYSESPSSVLLNNKFWGYEEIYGQCDWNNYRTLLRTYYIFWMKIKEHNDYEPC